jgi:hypothetical protein
MFRELPAVFLLAVRTLRSDIPEVLLISLNGLEICYDSRLVECTALLAFDEQLAHLYESEMHCVMIGERLRNSNVFKMELRSLALRAVM